MEYSWRYENALIGVFLRYDNTAAHDVTNPETTLDNHNVYNRLFVIDVSSDELEVPVFAKPAVESVISVKLQFPHATHTSKIVIPMYVNTYNQQRRTADSIVSAFFRVDFNQRLQKVTTNKGEVYYGGRGIILDKDFNILLLCTIACKKIEYGDRQVMSYYKPIIHVSPQVFLSGEGLIDKSILKKIIPFYLSQNIGLIYTANPDFVSDIPEGTKPQILIDDVSKLIENPVKPTPQKYSDDVLNQILADNADDVLNYF